MVLEDVLIKPVISEKANMLREQDKYVFIVRKDANKHQITDAVQKLFNVKVLNCWTINVRGKWRRTRNVAGLTPSYKKAIVRIAHGESIQAFEGI